MGSGPRGLVPASGRGLVPGGSGPRGVGSLGGSGSGVPGGDPPDGSMHPTGMHSCVKCSFM